MAGIVCGSCNYENVEGSASCNLCGAVLGGAATTAGPPKNDSARDPEKWREEANFQWGKCKDVDQAVQKLEGFGCDKVLARQLCQKLADEEKAVKNQNRLVGVVGIVVGVVILGITFAVALATDRFFLVPGFAGGVCILLGILQVICGFNHDWRGMLDDIFHGRFIDALRG